MTNIATQMKALVLNVGSSSIKFQLLNIATLEAEIIGKAVGIEGHKAGEIKMHLNRNGINSDMNRVLEKEVDAATGTTKGVSYQDGECFSLPTSSLALRG